MIANGLSITSFTNNFVFNPITNIAKSTYQALYESSIFFALNNEALADKMRHYKTLPWNKKFAIGVQQATVGNIPLILLTTIAGIDLLLQNSILGNNSIRTVTYGPILEELIFRGVIQQLTAKAQEAALSSMPENIKENRVFSWPTSRSARIIICNTLFAAVHLTNPGNSYFQALRIMALPAASILYETTDSIIAPIGYHLTHNGIAVINQVVLKMMIDMANEYY